MLILDTECFPNYWLLSVLNYETGEIQHFEIFPDSSPFPKTAIIELFKNNTFVGFNTINYDSPMIISALRGKNNASLKALSDLIIKGNVPTWKLSKEMGIVIPSFWDEIDLFAVAPGKSSLKAYGGRLGVQKLQDLPFDPDHHISPEERGLVKLYCENDLQLTKALYEALKPEIELRNSMSKQYGVDVRSKSDAQIAETVILSELGKMTGKTYRKPDANNLPTSFYLRSPLFISFKSEQLNDIYYRLLKEPFVLNSMGRIDLPAWLKKIDIVIGDTSYNMGIGGLHSHESSQCLRAEKGYKISDIDATSFYPSIILGQGLSPKSLGTPFLKVYQSLVSRRVEAKKKKDMTTANSLKIAVNGGFGKLGSIYSALYAPDLLIQTTITGQLALLMLIEQMEKHGIRIRSANTDGIVAYYHENQMGVLEEVVFNWEMITGFELEESEYKILASRDVNNYVAITKSNKAKTKGVFAPSFYASDKPTQFMLSKNPDRYIISLAVIAYLQNGTPIEETILSCKDVRHFTALRKVTGGAVWRGKEIGKTIRFYNSTEVPKDEAILYALNGNRVGTTAGCKPLMDLPDEFPSDIDYGYYIDEADKLLKSTGALV